MGDLLNRNGRLADSYSLKSISTAGELARAVFAKTRMPDVTLEFELTRDADGRLRIAGVRRYAELKKALAGTDLVEGLP